MKQFFYISIVLLAFLCQACIHTYPDAGAEDPTKVELAVDLSFNLKWGQILAYYPPTKSADYSHRFVIEVYEKDVVCLHHEEIITQEDFDKGFLRLPLPLSLKPNVYHVSVWCDLVDSATENPIAFNTESLLSISPMFSHGYSSLLEGCGTGSEMIDLTAYKDKLSARVIVPIELSPPVARFQLTATDVERFLEYADAAIQRGETYSVTLTYGDDYPATFNALLGEPAGYTESVEFSSQLPALFSKQITICSDWIFAYEDRREITVTLTLFNSARMIISRIKGINIPIERGKTTTVRGDFLTNFYSNSITVDNIWDGEIIIDID